MNMIPQAFANAIELKSADEDVDDTSIVTKALDGLSTTVDARLAAVEKKSADRMDKLEARLNRPTTASLSTAEEPSVERKAFTDYLRKGVAAETKALRVSDSAAGGFLAPEQFTLDFIRDLVPFSPMRSLATVKTTSAHTVTMPKRTAITNAKWKGEGVESEASEPAFGLIEIPVRELTTYVDVTNQLLEDSVADVEAEIRLALAEDFAAKEGYSFVNGVTALEPKGFMTATGIASTANGHATILSADALISLMYAVPVAYRGRGTWTMNADTMATIRKMKNADGDYIWRDGLADGQPGTLLGRPVVELPDMVGIAGGSFPVVFGDFATAYRIYDRVDLTVQVNPYLLMTAGMTRFHARLRVGGDVVQPNALRKLRMAVS